MARYVSRRLAQMVILFIIFLLATWLLLYSLPGDIVAQKFATNPNIPPEAKQIALERLGLDKAWYIQLKDYIINFFQLDFGLSFNQYPREVTSIIGERLPRTIVLFLTAIVSYYYAGFVAGKFLAWRRGKRGEMPVTIGGVTLYTVFYPWFALLLIWFFAAQLGWLPISKFLDPDQWRNAPFSSNTVFIRLFVTIALISIFVFGAMLLTRRIRDVRPRRAARAVSTAVGVGLFFGYWWGTSGGSLMRPLAADIAEHMILPVAALTLVNFAGIMLLTRSSMLETMREDFILTARAKGLSEKMVRDRHAARTAMLPVTTSLVLAVALVIDGGIITETVFAWPGMGEVLLSSVLQEDIPVAIAAFSLIGVMALIGHFIVDVLYGVLDPRIRVAGQA